MSPEFTFFIELMRAAVPVALLMWGFIEARYNHHLLAQARQY